MAQKPAIWRNPTVWSAILVTWATLSIAYYGVKLGADFPMWMVFIPVAIGLILAPHLIARGFRKAETMI